MFNDAGHYLSASAQMWSSTHNDTLKEKMSAVISVLSDCQEKIGSGYLSAFPSELFDRFEAVKPVWAPYYTIHKVGKSTRFPKKYSKFVKLQSYFVDFLNR